MLHRLSPQLSAVLPAVATLVPPSCSPPSEERVKHASLEAPAMWEVPPAAAHHLPQVGAVDQAG